ncbi:MAG: DUF2380 domain-containing protein [Gammaproteobacteria bacterium]|nr:DUF2380 domain-containing protein [Gammaproteobacteria bacterium]
MPQGQQPIVVRSPDWLRATVPGQIAWDNARTAWANDNYGWAVAHTGAMVAEQVVVVLSLGQASLYTQGARATSTTAASTVQTERLLASPVLHDHHLLPQQFRRFFSSRGINIDEHAVTLSEAVHLRGVHGSGIGNMPGRWNQQWAQWIEANPNATAKDIYQQLGRMMDDFGLGGSRIHPYGQ